MLLSLKCCQEVLDMTANTPAKKLYLLAARDFSQARHILETVQVPSRGIYLSVIRSKVVDLNLDPKNFSPDPNLS